MQNWGSYWCRTFISIDSIFPGLDVVLSAHCKIQIWLNLWWLFKQNFKTIQSENYKLMLWGKMYFTAKERLLISWHKDTNNEKQIKVINTILISRSANINALYQCTGHMRDRLAYWIWTLVLETNYPNLNDTYKLDRIRVPSK